MILEIVRAEESRIGFWKCSMPVLKRAKTSLDATSIAFQISMLYIVRFSHLEARQYSAIQFRTMKKASPLGQ